MVRRGEGDVDGDEVAFGEDFVEGAELDAEGLEALGGDEGVVADDVHLEAAGATGDFGADAAEAEDAEGLAAQLDADELAALPLAGGEGRVGGGDVAGEGEHQADGVLGGGDGDGGGGVDDDDAAGGGRVDVDVVDADAGAADDDEVACRRRGLRR